MRIKKLLPIETGIKLQILSAAVDLPENSNYIERLMMNMSTGYTPNDQHKPKQEDLRFEAFKLNNQSPNGYSSANGGCTKGMHPREMHY